ncbi:MAG TPA: universal stress protein [Chloroflexota bacterium]|nr:universal stress protein [Chloroflexota bacterium]HUM69323.1 universal stress protein [Chloroflexota bacterium]
MFTHILVPLDGSKLAEAALPMALAIAGRFESAITLLRVVSAPHFVVNSHDFAQLYVSLNEDLREEAAAYIQLKQNDLMRGGFVVNGRVAEGESVADIILNAADELGVDAIVMSTHGHGGIKRWVFGSVADRILQQAHVPILLVRAQTATSGT